MEGYEIRQRREALGWTQQKLAEAVGVGQRTIGNWERGETVPKNRMGMLERIFAEHGPQNGSGDLLGGFPDAVLLSELLRRALTRER